MSTVFIKDGQMYSDLLITKLKPLTKETLEAARQEMPEEMADLENSRFCTATEDGLFEFDFVDGGKWIKPSHDCYINGEKIRVIGVVGVMSFYGSIDKLTAKGEQFADALRQKRDEWYSKGIQLGKDYWLLDFLIQTEEGNAYTLDGQTWTNWGKDTTVVIGSGAIKTQRQYHGLDLESHTQMEAVFENEDYARFRTLPAEVSLETIQGLAEQDDWTNSSWVDFK